MKINILFCSLTAIIGIHSLGLAQAPDTLWTRSFGGPHNDYVYDMKPTSDGGFILAGSGIFGTGGPNIYFIRTDADGDTIWTRFFDVDDSDYASSIQKTDDGGYIAACNGFTNLIKLDDFGDSLWSHDYGIVAKSVWPTDDGGYIIGGGVVDGPWIIKTDSLGNVVWSHFYGNDYFSHVNYIQQTLDGGYVAVGTAYSDENWSDYYIMKMDESGDTLWTRSYGSSGPEEAYCAQQTSDGGYILSGLSFWTVKTDSAGDTTWCRYYGYGGTGCAFSLEETRDGGFIIGGRINHPVMGDPQFYMVKIWPDGNYEWDFVYGAAGCDFGHEVCETVDGGYAMAGWSDSCGIGGMDILLIKLGFPVKIDELSASIPEHISLWGNYPNPFNSSTTIEFVLEEECRTKLTVYDLLGRKTATLVDMDMEAGRHHVIWDASDYPSGLYFYRLETGNFSNTRKMVLLK